jgi:D-alanyl-lipoteichoic acid acyltransferase DltB (MBOAT superfamily)
MNFTQASFLLFLGAVLALYYLLARTPRQQNLVMVVAGSAFYAAFEWWYLGLLYATIALQYTVGRLLEPTDDQRRRKLLVAVAVVGQLAMLGFFKYFDFFSESVADGLAAFGLSVDPVTLEIVLPLGISFYTFQSLTYVLSLYRGQIPAQRDLVTFAAFVSWFPNLIAGPIEHARTLMPQLERRRQAPAAPLVESAVTLFLRGLFKKVVVADSIGGFVGTVFADPGRFRWSTVGLATLGFAIQVYADFSGYSDMARATSRLLSVELRRNFEQPFLSRNMREFWLRWHTSLRQWFTENVAGPLGAGEASRGRAALIVVFMFGLIGLWHGADWTYVIWGLYNGVLVAMWRFLPEPRRHPMKLRLGELPQILLTFGLFCLGAVFFRAGSLGDAVTALEQMVTLSGGEPGPNTKALVPVMTLAVLALDLLERRQRIRAIETLRVRAPLGGVPTRREAAAESIGYGMRPVTAGATAGVLIAALIVFAGGTPQPFIYFQF